MKKRILTLGLVGILSLASVGVAKAGEPNYQTFIVADEGDETEVIFNEISKDEKEYWVVNNSKEETKEDCYLEAEKVDKTRYVGVAAGLNFRKFPNTAYNNIFKAFPYGTEVKVVGESKIGWSVVEVDNNKYFCWSEYLMDEAPIFESYEMDYTYDMNETYVAPVSTTITASSGQYSAGDLQSQGVIYSDGWRWTWYSQNVLPGGGLNIPGRHVDENGYVCDESGYICIASSSLSKGTVVSTPFGKEAKVYDSGCASDTLDVYTNF